MKKPESMEEVVYFTRRAVDNGKIMAWAFKEMCPECGKALMGKPVEKGKVKIRAKEYVCPECDHTVEKKEYEETLTLSVEYTCQHCGNNGEAQIPFKRKNYQGVKAFVFKCSKCGKDIPVTKKMKEI